MKRKETKPNYILCSDIHLMDKTPICRTDKYVEETQWIKLDWLSDLSHKYQAPVLHAGDLFDKAKTSIWLISKAIKHLPQTFLTVAGNHDLPEHNINNLDQSSLGLLSAIGRVKLLDNGHWGDEIEFPSLVRLYNGKVRNILVNHVMVYKGNNPYGGLKANTAKKLLERYSAMDLIVTGDNHEPFVEKIDGRILVNPGSLGRIKADQIEHRPRVYLYFGKTNTVKPVYVPINPEAVSDAHLRGKEAHNDKLQAFIQSLDSDNEIADSFWINLERYLQSNNKISNEVVHIINKATEHEKDNN